MATLKSTLILSAEDRASAVMRRISGTMDAFQRQARGFMAPLTGTVGRLAAFGAAYVGATAGIQSTIGAARDMQAALTEIGIKASLSDRQLEILRGQVLKLAPATNQTTQDLLAGVDTMIGLGLTAEQAAAAIPAIGKAATATGSSMADLSAATVSAMQNMNVAAADLPRMLDAMAAAGNAGAFELRDMAKELPTLGAAYKGLGQEGVSAVTDLAAALQIVRKGTGDSASAATNLGNLLQKVNAPATRRAFKKMGVNLEREMARAADRGLTPIEAIAELTDKTLKGNLGRLGDLFEDSQVQQALRPLIQNMEEFRRLREEAGRASGTVDQAFASRMENANEKLKALQVRMQTVGSSIGLNLLEPISAVAEHLSRVFDTMDERVSVFDRMAEAAKGFMGGLLYNPDTGETSGIGGTLKSISDMIFGIQTDGVTAGEELGRISAKFREFGTSIRYVVSAVANNPVAKFLGELSGYGLGLMASVAGIGLVAGAIRSLASALLFLSGAKAALSILRGIAGLTGLSRTAGAVNAAATAAGGADADGKKQTGRGAKGAAAAAAGAAGALPVGAVPAGGGIALPVATIAIGGAALSEFSRRVTAALPDETRKSLYQNPLLGAFAGDTGLAAAIMDADRLQQPVGKDVIGEAVAGAFTKAATTMASAVMGAWELFGPQGRAADWIVPRPQKERPMDPQSPVGGLADEHSANRSREERPRVDPNVGFDVLRRFEDRLARTSVPSFPGKDRDNIIPVASVIDRMLRGMERFAPPVALPTQAHPGKTADDVAPLPELDIGTDGLASAIDGLRASFEAYAARNEAPPATPAAAPAPAQQSFVRPEPMAPQPMPSITPEVDMAPARTEVSQAVMELAAMLNLRGGVAFDSSALDAAASKLRSIISLIQQAQRSMGALNNSRLDTSGAFADSASTF